MSCTPRSAGAAGNVALAASTSFARLAIDGVGLARGEQDGEQVERRAVGPVAIICATAWPPRSGTIPGVEPEELAGAFKRLADWAAEHAPDPEPAVRRHLREHLGADPTDMPIVSRALAPWDRPNFQVAIDAWSEGREVEVVGLPVTQGYRAGLAELSRGPAWLAELEPSALEHVTVPLGERESVTCVQSGFWLVRDAEGPLVVMLKSESHGMGETLGLEVMAPARERAERVLTALWELMSERNVYRGRILELRSRHFHGDEGAPLTVRTLPSITRDRIVFRRASWSGSSAKRSVSPTTPSACARAAGTFGAACCCTARRAPARRSARCTSPRRCPGAPSCF
jgi:hypothetical protein